MPIAENEILRMMNKLQCTREEAIQLIQDDESEEMTPEQAELEAKAKTLKRRYETSDKPRKKAERVRKVDEVKKGLLDLVLDALQDTVKITEIKNELACEFEYNGQSYGLKITRHRDKKNKK